MTAPNEPDPDVEIVKLLGDIDRLRAVIDSELDREGGASRSIILAASELLREKNERLEELGWIE